MPTIATDPEAKNELLTRGVAEIIGKNDLEKRLDNGERLRVKLGVDPTSPHVHLGRSIPLLKLRDFQDLGHQVVFIVGDFTGVIGDTSDKDSERPMLSQETIDANKKSYFDQVGKLIDLEKAEFRYNSEWLAPLTYREICEHANIFSVNEFIGRENIWNRLKAGKRVSLREVLYPLMQGYDSVAIRADVELGGTDQRFNMLAGRTMQEHFGKHPQAVMMGPLINGLDGRKMSSSWGNTITLDALPVDMYGKIMSLRDNLIATYFELCTRIPMSEIHAIKDGLEHNTMHPKDVKMRLAREIVTMYHGEHAAAEAEASFTRTFNEGGVPDDVVGIEAITGTLLVDVLVGAGIISSKADFRRLIDDGAVTVVESGEKITDPHTIITRSSTFKIGKRRFARISVT